MAHLGDENLIPMYVQAGVDVAGTEVVRAWHTVRLDPADCAWIGNQDFVLAEIMTLVLSPDFCTLFQMLSCLPDVYSEVKLDVKTRELAV
jgi:hypothetical protein